MNTQKLVVATAWTAAACFGGEAKVKQIPLGVRIRVSNEAAVPAHVLGRAKETVSKILDQAGVEATWLDCPGEPDSETRRLCNQELGKADFRLHLVVRKIPGADRDTLGSALVGPLGNSSAYVYYPDNETLGKNLQRDTSLVLAATTAHEIGHLLLGEIAHSRTGIMSAKLSSLNLDLAQRAYLFFTPDQARLIRSQITAMHTYH
jgi:hypothetical protein